MAYTWGWPAFRNFCSLVPFGQELCLKRDCVTSCGLQSSHVCVVSTLGQGISEPWCICVGFSTSLFVEDDPVHQNRFLSLCDWYIISQQPLNDQNLSKDRNRRSTDYEETDSICFFPPSCYSRRDLANDSDRATQKAVKVATKSFSF